MKPKREIVGFFWV